MVLTPILLIQVLQFPNFYKNGSNSYFLVNNLKRILVAFALSVNYLRSEYKAVYL